MSTTTPPSLLSLTIDSAVLHLSYFPDLSRLPDHIITDLFLRTLKAGKLTERVLKLFLATGNDEVLAFIEALNIQHILVPVLPTSKVFGEVLELPEFVNDQLRFLDSSYCQWIPSFDKEISLQFKSMSQPNIKDEEVDIVIGTLRSDLTSFMNEWRPIFSRYHLIIVKDPDLREELKIPNGFDVDVYSKQDIDKTVGSSSISFSGYSCRYFGFLKSRKKYVVSIDDDCLPARDDKGDFVDVVAQHINNLGTPATPFFFNTLYDPFRKGTDFVRGYPFSLRSGVACALSCGLWLNLADYDAPTQALKPGERNNRYVDAVLTVPTGCMMPVSGINIAFDREVIGPTLFPALKLAAEGKYRWETVEDIWCGLCVKEVCDHLCLGVKSGLPYVWRNDRGNAIESLKKEWQGVKLMEHVVPFFQSVRLPRTVATVEDCVAEMAANVKQQLGATDPAFARAADSMLEWLRIWKDVGTGSHQN